jgi:hypothetical protein
MSSSISIRRLKASVSRIHFRAYLPHTTFPRRLAKGVTISDQFLYRGDIVANRFVAENALALLLAQPVEVTHRLIFFDPEGRHLINQTHTSSNYFASISIDPIGAEYATFLHTTTYADSCLPEEELLSGSSRSLQRLHRGYSLYQRTADSVFAAVHGNFGGIVTDESRFPARQQLLARHRSPFLYTPQHRFAMEDRVWLYVMNSCPSTETVEIVLPATEQEPEPRIHDRLTIPPLGVGRCVLSAVGGYLSFRSRLPMCRPLVFVEKAGNPHHFDVFHT